jgi:hypothetical protein
MPRDLSEGGEATSVVGSMGRIGFRAEEHEPRIAWGRAGIRPQP